MSAGSCRGPRGRQAWGRCPGDSSDAARLTAASRVSRELHSASLDRRLQGELALVHSRLRSLRLSLGPGVRLDLPTAAVKDAPTTQAQRIRLWALQGRPLHREPSSHRERGTVGARPTRPCPGPLALRKGPSRCPVAGQAPGRPASGAGWTLMEGGGTCCTGSLALLCRCPVSE